ncbi:hypothetical protein MKW98_022443 [Papaver atlanticum]|uniref:4-coumarate--CoA ligase n=1 Tax=Papaver atlanticum TaxID=357466 RepID=A0AAD4S0L7_9MAGN|nr:hypothetical protein MKW98_022443 [Papaver atlanticum]
MAEFKDFPAMKIDPKSGFCSETVTYHSLRPIVPLPPVNSSLSTYDYVFSLFRSISNSSPETTTALIDSETNTRISYSVLIQKIESLSHHLKSVVGLSKGDTAFILSPTSPQIPILYFSLLSIGVAISPSNPTSTVSEISHQISLSKPLIAFATSRTAHKLPSVLHHGTILLDSADFELMMTEEEKTMASRRTLVDLVDKVNQLDTAAVLYSSGTTGRVKGVMLSHRNFTSLAAGIYGSQLKNRGLGTSDVVVLCTVPLFHVYGLVCILKAVAMGETLVVMDQERRFEVGRLMKIVEDYKVTNLAVAPPVILAVCKGPRMDHGYDMRSLTTVVCGGARLLMEVISRFRDRYPNLVVAQAYGLTETTGGVFRTLGVEESRRIGSTGRLSSNMQAKIVDPETGTALPPCKQGELWVKGAAIMKGYVGEEEATLATLDRDGWLKTGDLCYIDNEGYLYVIDRLKELIKYKGYQVAPAELEELLQSHPDILDAVVIPYPNEEAGQVPMAFLVKRPHSSIDEPQVMDFIAKQVSPYKKIRKVKFIDCIPRNAPGKILRKELIKLALSSRTTTTKTAAKL